MAVNEATGTGAAMASLPPRRAAGAADEAANDGASGWVFVATLASWVMLLLGQRVLDAEEGLAKMLTGLALTGLVVAFGHRVWSWTQVSDDRKPAALAFAILSAVGLLGAAGYYAATDAGRALLGVEAPAVGAADNFSDTLTVVWVTLVVISILPTIMGELSRRSMLRAERVESRRVVAAVISGVALALAASYGSLFTYAAQKSDVFADFSYFRVAKPSESTVRMIDSLEEPLKAMVFFPGHSELRPKVVRYLEELRTKSAKIQVEVYDRAAVPDLAKEHKVRKDGVVVLSSGKMSKILDIGVDEKRAATKLKKLDGEFQKVLVQVMRSKRVAYLTVGHGELNESTDKTGRSASFMRKLLEAENYTLKNLGLSQGLGSEIPDDAALVLVLGPSEAFSEPEVDTLRRYADGGGKLVLALDADAKVDLAPLAAAVGVKWSQELVVNDKVFFRYRRTEADKKYLVVKRFSSHPTVSTLSKSVSKGAAILFGGSGSLDKLEGAAGYQVDFAVKSAPGSYQDVNGNWRFDKDSEKKVTLNLVAAVSRKLDGSSAAKKGKKAPKDDAAVPEMRAVVLADADVFSDGLFRIVPMGHQVFFREVVRWLAGEESFTGAINEEEDVAIAHTKSEDQVWFFSTILGAPSLVAGFGLIMSRRRRKKVRKTPPGSNSPAAKKSAERAEKSSKEGASSKQAKAGKTSKAAADKRAKASDQDEESEA